MNHSIPFWRKAPFIKLLVAMVAGILLQWHGQINITVWLIVLPVATAAMIAFFFLPFYIRHRISFVSGIAGSLIFMATGAVLAYQKDIRNNKQWVGHFYQPKDAVIITLDEPLTEKTKSLKANATVNYLLHTGQVLPVKGNIIVYFKKDSLGSPPCGELEGAAYGSRIIFTKPLQEIKNAGNPAGFDYKRYSLFHGITHQVFLGPGDYEVLPGKKRSWFPAFIFATRQKVLNVLRANIPGNKERGLAEALLIGYKNDLDQALVQSYTNTGVVHIIAISGLHIGLIYWLLALLCRPMKKNKITRWVRPLLIIAGLWLFSILCGAQPSVLRSALMFTCIVMGESLQRRSSIINSLACSAFILLCINPYWLWDVGFQLSYAAVLSIVLFMRPIYGWWYSENKIVDFLWRMNSVTLAAQVLTVPLSIYHFHQFPNYFLLTNLVAVPLSSLIVLGEILLCAVAWLPVVAHIIGRLLSWLISIMNGWIEKIEALPFSLWDGLQMSMSQMILSIMLVSGAAYWLMEKARTGLKVAMVALFSFVVLRSWSLITAGRQAKIIVYNVPQRRAIDIIHGRKYFFIGDTDLLTDGFARNFHLKPSRILMRISPAAALPGLVQDDRFVQYGNKKILLIDTAIRFLPAEPKPVIDLLLISKNPKLYIGKLAAAITIKQVVFDGSVPAWKARYWKKDCDSLHIPWYDVAEGGAFVMNLR